VHQNRLNLIVGGMSGSDDLQLAFVGDSGQESVADDPGRFFERPPVTCESSHILAFDDGRELVVPGDGQDAFRLTPGPPPELVIKMGDDNFVPEVLKAIQGAQTVGTARNAQDNPLAGDEKFMRLNGRSDLRQDLHTITDYSIARLSGPFVFT
jgi:hypothetical protein